MVEQMSRVARALVIAMTAWACSGVPSTAVARQNQDASEEQASSQQAESLGALAPHLHYGKEVDGPWTGETDGNGYRLFNSEDPNSIKYMFLNPERNTDGMRTFSVKTLAIKGDGSVGLCYGFREQPKKEYYLLMLDTKGLLQAFHRAPEGGLTKLFHVTLEGNADPDGKPAGPLLVTLKIIEDGTTAKAFVNDTEIGTFEGSAVGQGGIGIAGLGQIDGLFLDFSLESEDPQATEEEGAPANNPFGATDADKANNPFAPEVASKKPVGSTTPSSNNKANNPFAPEVASKKPVESTTPNSNNKANNPLASKPRTGTTIFRQHTVTDPGMSDQPAVHVLVPEGWNVDGGMLELSSSYSNIPFLLDFSVTGPDGRRAHFLPSARYDFVAQQPGKMFAPSPKGNITIPMFESPGQWLLETNRANSESKITNLKLVSEEMLPELTKTLREQPMMAEIYQHTELFNQQSRQTEQETLRLMKQNPDLRITPPPVVYTQFDARVTQIVLRYTEDGRDLEETVFLSWSSVLTEKRGQIAGGFWMINTMRAIRGPVGSGYLNDPEIMAVFKSARNDPKWQAEMERRLTKRFGTPKKGSSNWRVHNQKMEQIRQQTSDIISQGYQARTAMRDSGQQNYVDMVHEVTPYATTDGYTVRLPSFYDNVYTDGNDRFILTNDALYNPQSDNNLSGDWRRIRAHR